jgi:hypothetical protein
METHIRVEECRTLGCHVELALVTTDLTEEHIASIIRVTKPRGVTSQNTALFIATAVKTSNLT